MTEPPPTYIATVPAAEKVRRFARGADELATFLDMLGLVQDGVIAPDDVRHYDLPSASPIKASPGVLEPSPTVRDLHPERCTTPAGLRNLGGAA